MVVPHLVNKNTIHAHGQNFDIKFLKSDILSVGFHSRIMITTNNTFPFDHDFHLLQYISKF